MSVFLFTLGTIISVFSFGGFEHTVFANLGHMYMVGPLCICSAITIGVRNVLYLRRRRVIDMVIRQQIEVTGNFFIVVYFSKSSHCFCVIDKRLLYGARSPFQDIRSQQAQLADPQQQYSLPVRTVSEITLPPSYEQLIGGRNDEEESGDPPPPSYEEALMNMSSRAGAAATKSDSDVIVLNYSVK